MKIQDLENIEKHLDRIKSLLNPVDAPYVCDVIIKNIHDEMLADLLMEMMLRMRYSRKKILEVARIAKEIQM